MSGSLWEPALMLGVLAALLMLFLIALSPAWFDRACDACVRGFNLAIAWGCIAFLLILAALLEAFTESEPFGEDAETDRRMTIGMRSARRRGLLPDDLQ